MQGKGTTKLEQLKSLSLKIQEVTLKNVAIFEEKGEQ